MNLGQITSLVYCTKCGNHIEIYPSEEDVKCSVCNNCIGLKMREFTKEESKQYDESIFKMFKPTGKNIFDL